MSTRLQVVLDESEMAEIRRYANAQQLTVAEWVRRSLRAARRRLPASDSGRKVAVVRAAVRYQFPPADIDLMLAETEAGYHSGTPD